MTGSAAALLNGVTLHSAAHFESANKQISDTDRKEWEGMRIKVIDELFCSQQQLEKLDKILRRLRSQLDQPYGGLNIIFISVAI